MKLSLVVSALLLYANKNQGLAAQAFQRQSVLFVKSNSIHNNKNANIFSFSIRSDGPIIKPTRRLKNGTQLYVQSTISKNNSIDVMGGVQTFEQWWTSKAVSSSGGKDSTTLKLIQHAALQGGLLRGLQYNGPAPNKTIKNIIRIPRNKVLAAPYYSTSGEISSSWDTNLALKLLNECSLGTASSVYGYCSLLCQGNDFKEICAKEEGTPPLTAPDALRHWAAEQKLLLSKCAKGQKLLEVERTNRVSWEDKYKSSNASSQGYTLQQFIWAMEAVHSRAFCGDFGPLASGTEGGSSVVTIPVSFAVPLVAAVIGYNALMDPMNENGEIIAVALAAIVALVPLLSQVLGSANRKGSAVAVLLPFIDSANHLESADSTIEFDPLSDCITLSAGPNCFVKDAKSENTQLFVSYGKKTDEELLLNYGFLPNVDLSDVTVESVGDEKKVHDMIRRKLAEAFVARNS